MNLKKQNLALFVAAIALAVPTTLQLRSEAEIFKDIASIPLLFDGFTSDNVGTILMGQPKKDQPPPDPQNPDQKRPIAYDQMQIVRTEKGWAFAPILGQPPNELAGAPVSKDRVESDIFAHLRAIRVDRDTIVQPNANPEQLAEYGLDDAHAFVFKLVDTTGKNVVAELFVGRDAAAGQQGTEAVRGVFVRKNDSNDVILYEFDRGWRRDVLTDQWLDRVLAKLEPDKIHRFSIRNTATAGTTFVFERKDGKASWQAVDAPADVGAVRQMEVENLIQRLRWIAAQDFRKPLQHAGNLAALGLAPAQIEIELTVKEGDQDRVIKIAVGNKVDDKNEYYMTCSEAQFLMTWQAGYVTTFELDAKAKLFDPPPPQPDKPPDAPRDDK
ncbi:MAG TPA: DUF4340 domain-containing protein [Planctomycetota bacterium]|nr:DUF4340 domain-containing protein [Planctomycetota bacterium]